jgi:hypothetical protein
MIKIKVFLSKKKKVNPFSKGEKMFTKFIILIFSTKNQTKTLQKHDILYLLNSY